MYKKLLVPLDGSPLAEKALPLAVRLARELKAELILARVIELPEILSDNLKHKQELLKITETYFQEVTEAVINTSLPYALSPSQIHTAITFGDSKTELVKLVSIYPTDLIVMTTHGYSLQTRLALGSVASYLLKHTNTPVILIRPQEIPQTVAVTDLLNQPLKLGIPAQVKTLVVVLDGTPDEEIVLNPAIELARQLGGCIQLLEVVPRNATVLTSQILKQQNASTGEIAGAVEAGQYLDKVKTFIEKQGVGCVRAVRVGELLSEIERYAKTEKASLLVMPAFGSSDVHRMMVGSVAEEVVRQSHLPVMIVHPKITFSQVKFTDKLIFY